MGVDAGSAARPYDVAIVGFGPVGAILAGLLGRRGLRVVVFDREVGLYPLPRAAHADHTALRTLQELGSLDRLLPGMLVNPGTDCVSATREVLFRIPSDQPTPSGLPASMYFYQPLFDGELRRNVGERDGVDVRLATEVVEVDDEGDGVRLRAVARGGGGEDVYASWVVGCDGASSTVRTSLGIERDDFGFREQWLIFDLELGTPRPPLPELAIQVCDPARPRTELPMPGNRFRFELMLMPGEDPGEVLREPGAQRALLDPLVPASAATVERTGTYTFFGAVAAEWRRGRVFLAGDAAHLMPPFLGQGMCSGIRDVANLAWKLDRVVRGVSSSELLDTYQLERRPHVAEVIHHAVEFGRIICITDPEEADRRNAAYRADPRPLDRRFTFRLPGLAPGPLVLPGGGRLFPQPALDDGAGRLDDWIGQRFLVLGRDDAALGSSRACWEADPDVLVRTLDQVPGAQAALRAWLDRAGAGVVVVRPDRYVLGTAERLDDITGRVRGLLGLDE